eukprot:5722829-Prymnesium_polylepis.1
MARRLAREEHDRAVRHGTQHGQHHRADDARHRWHEEEQLAAFAQEAAAVGCNGCQIVQELRS